MQTAFVRYAAELVGLADIMVAIGSFGLGPLQQATRSDADRVGCGSSIQSARVSFPSLAQPGGNITGFTSYEYSPWA